MSRRGAGIEADLAIDPAATAKILEGFLRVEVGRTGRRAVVIGLSGGIDSAVAATLAVRALGPAAVHGVLLPHRDSSPDSVTDAERLVGRLGIVAEKIDITPLVDGFVAAAGKPGAEQISWRRGNRAHRCGRIRKRCCAPDRR